MHYLCRRWPNSSLDTSRVKPNYEGYNSTSVWNLCEKFKKARLSARSAKLQRTQQINTCTRIYPLLVIIHNEFLGPLPSPVHRTHDEVVGYSPHALMEDNDRISSQKWTRMGEIVTGHTPCPNPTSNHCAGGEQSAPVGRRLGPVPAHGIHILARHTHTGKTPTNTPRDRSHGKFIAKCYKLNSFHSLSKRAPL